MNLPLQSIRRASFGVLIVLASPAAAILSPSIMIVAFWTICDLSGLIIVPLTSAIFSARAVRAKMDNARASVILSFIVFALVLAFYQNRGFAIERGVIGFAWSQIKFVDNNVDERGGRHGQKNSQQTKHRRRRERKEQDVDRVQLHLFAKHAWDKNIQLDLVNQYDYGKSQPEFCGAHAQGDQQNRNGNEKCANGRKKLAKKRKHAKNKCRLHADQPKQRAYGDAGDYAIDGDSARPRSHLSHQSRECAMGLLAITIRYEREIGNDDRPGTCLDKNEQECGENDA